MCFVLTFRGGTTAFFLLFWSPFGRSGGHFDVIMGLFFELLQIYIFWEGPVWNRRVPWPFFTVLGGTEGTPCRPLWPPKVGQRGQKAPETIKKWLFLHLRVAMLDMLIPLGKLTFTLLGTHFWECRNLIKNGGLALGRQFRGGIIDKTRFCPFLGTKTVQMDKNAARAS